LVSIFLVPCEYQRFSHILYLSEIIRRNVAQAYKRIQQIGENCAIIFTLT